MKIKRIALPYLILALVGTGVQAQNCNPQDWSNHDGDKCKQNLSVFHSDVKQSNFEGAYKPWRYYYCNCPKDDGSQEWVYIDGAKLMAEKIKANKSDKALLDAWYDSLMMVYDNWQLSYGKEGKIAGYKGLYTYAYQNHKLDRLVESQAYFEKSIELLDSSTTYSTVSYYMAVLQKLAKYKKVDTAYWVDKYFVVSGIVDVNIAKGGGYLSKWQKTREDIDNLMQPVLTCGQLLPIYDKKLENNPSADELKKMVAFMELKECTSSPTYEKAANMLCDLDPSAICKNALARLKYKQNNYSDAKKYVEEAITYEEDILKKSDYYLLLADINEKLGSAAASMDAVNRALALNPSNARAYIIKGGLYAELAKGCADFDRKAAYWVVVDQYMKAKALDPSQTDLCNSRIATYSQYFPTAGEIFFQTDANGQTLKVGDSYLVACLGLSTTIRAKVGE